ncbi:signal peptidase I [Serpentinicella alkaliphila]|uniref:Signal peptidase I n=1 Tax=Serpentinicella alkaliphila TaxID=1734049 RepID=A0A4R2TAY0_9FIRM|nr:signal peptidase I [Serpentinicella alkaliphila]QUH26557.1 signal peptidase I [Serpentinicella alkaliphila]TCP99041.1 signal peptidase I [Serpentinicella alkaliphila]
MNKNEAIEWIKALGVSVILAAFLVMFARPTIVYGDSMNQTLQHKDILLTNQAYYKVKDFTYGDIIVFKSIENTNYIKRVIGVGGDVVKILNGVVYINDVELIEEYIFEDDYLSSDLEVIVPEGKVFVLGDNRNDSKDSRHWAVGLVDESIIVGRAYVRLFPFKNIGSI